LLFFQRFAIAVRPDQFGLKEALLDVLARRIHQLQVSPEEQINIATAAHSLLLLN